MKRLKLITICAVVGILLTAGADVKGADTKLLLHFDGNDGATATVDSSGQNHPITPNGDAQLDTADKVAGSASLLLDGTGDYLTIPDSPDWDIFASNADSWTIDFWVRHDSHSPFEVYLHHYGAGKQLLISNENAGLAVYSSVVNLSAAGKISDNAWYWIAFCKVADEYGMYKDGVQINYAQTSNTGTVDGTLYIGSYSGGGNYNIDGHMDELRITHGNLYGADPQADFSDEIEDVPEPATICLLGLGVLGLLRRKTT